MEESEQVEGHKISDVVRTDTAAGPNPYILCLMLMTPKVMIIVDMASDLNIGLKLVQLDSFTALLICSTAANLHGRLGDACAHNGHTLLMFQSSPDIRKTHI